MVRGAGKEEKRVTYSAGCVNFTLVLQIIRRPPDYLLTFSVFDISSLLFRFVDGISLISLRNRIDYLELQFMMGGKSVEDMLPGLKLNISNKNPRK